MVATIEELVRRWNAHEAMREAPSDLVDEDGTGGQRYFDAKDRARRALALAEESTPTKSPGE